MYSKNRISVPSVIAPVATLSAATASVIITAAGSASYEDAPEAVVHHLRLNVNLVLAQVDFMHALPRPRTVVVLLDHLDALHVLVT